MLPSSCDWSCKLSLAQTGACDGEGHCLCQGELDDTDHLFDLEETEENDAGVRIEMFEDDNHNTSLDLTKLLEKRNLPAPQQILHISVERQLEDTFLL